MRLAGPLLVVALLGGAACGAPDRHPLAPAAPAAAPVPRVAANDDNPVVYTSLHMQGAGGFRSDSDAPADALKTPQNPEGTTTAYELTESLGITNGSKAAIEKAIKDRFQATDDNDVSVISFSSHGQAGKLTTGSAEFTGQDLKALLSSIKGTKIVIISACFSGSLIDGADELGSNKDDKIVVLTSAAADQKSGTSSPMFKDDPRGHALFIGWTVAGLSDDGAGNARADADKNGEVTVEELFNYAAPKTEASAAKNGKTQVPKNTFDKPGGDQLKKVPILRYKKGTLAKYTDVPFADAKAADQCGTSFRCTLGARSSSYVDVVTEAFFGLESIVPTKALNASVAIPAFTTGTTDPVISRATKIDLTQPAQVELRVTDVSGAATTCDPVLVEVSRATGKPVVMTLTGLPAAESRISIANGTPGLTNLRIEVNGRAWQVSGLEDGEARALDVSAAMRPGNANTIVLTPLGRPGGGAVVLIHD